ncbi:VWA domain-containing protein [Scytonema sp. PRP1]|uniref:VWA domain-containing protein n=1 Tax=Scytonema sp. PRP1 TaxID=3120513 RepID=UPI00300D0348
MQLSERRFIFVPQFPLTYREVAQTWRRLRRPVRVGPATELDLDATIARRSQQGIAASVVLRPRRRNVARLLLLVDRQGSMTPFHRFCEEVCRAIQQAGRLQETAIYYFHNVPAEGADEQLLEPLSNELFPVLDEILPEITPLKTGYLYEDPDLLSPVLLEEVLQKYAADAFVVVISDADAVRKYYNVVRLLDTISFIKALRAYTLNYVWLNPLPKSYWKDNTAAQIARHVPMFPLNREGIQQAVNVLRGHQYIIEKPL